MRLAEIGEHLHPADVHVARAIGRLTGEVDEDVLAAAALAVRAPRIGDVCVDLAAAHAGEDDDAGTVTTVAWPEPASWAERLAASGAVRRAGEDRDAPLVLDGHRLYLDRYWRYEDRLARRLEELAAGSRAVDEAALGAALDRLFPEGDGDSQRRAAAQTAQRTLTVITGGPGTGKTSTIVRIVALARMLERDARIAVAAPTGKAAARLGEALDELAHPALVDEVKATTVHRLLGTQRRNSTRFRHDRERPLPADLVIVDEASMVSLPLLSKLVEAIAPGARVVLVGDRDQLASVEAGAAFAAICGPTDPSVQGADAALIAGRIVTLDRHYRFGPESGIGALARAVRRGAHADAEAFLAGASTEQGEGAYDDIALVEPDGEALPAAVREEVVAGYASCLAAIASGAAPEAVLAAFDRQRVLCALRRGPDGVAALNEAIAGWLADADPSFRPEHAWAPGRPVIVTRNDYSVGLFNGDVGIVVPDPDDPGRPFVAFPTSDGARLVPPSRLPPHETAFALSIHKSQGSQFDRAYVVLPTVSSPILTRELLYTAVTRAREHVTVVAEVERLREAIAHKTSRVSGLADRLWAAG